MGRRRWLAAIRCVLAPLLILSAAVPAAAEAGLAVVDCLSATERPAPGCRPAVPGMTEPRQVAVSPDGRSVYVLSGYVPGRLFIFDVDRRTGELTWAGCVADDDLVGSACAYTSPGLSGAFSIVISPDGRSAYVGSAEESTLAVFKRSPGKGILRPRGCVADPAATDPCDQTSAGLRRITSLAISPDGDFLYASSTSSFGENPFITTRGAIVVFDRHSGTGRLTPTGCVADDDNPTHPCPGEAPGLGGVKRLALSPDGGSLYAVSPGDLDGEDALVHLRRDPTTGALEAVGCYGLPTECATVLTPYYKTELSISPDGRHAYLSASDQLRILARSADGSLADRGCIGSYPGCAPFPASFDPSSSVLMPEAVPRRAYLVTGGGIFALRRNTDTGGLTPIESIYSPVFVDAAVDASGQYLYAVSGFPSPLIAVIATSSAAANGVFRRR